MTQSLGIDLVRTHHGQRDRALRVVTAFNRALIDRQPQVHRALRDATPVGRFCEADHPVVASFLVASEASAFITGQTLFIDGGLTVV